MNCNFFTSKRCKVWMLLFMSKTYHVIFHLFILQSCLNKLILNIYKSTKICFAIDVSYFSCLSRKRIHFPNTFLYDLLPFGYFSITFLFLDVSFNVTNTAEAHGPYGGDKIALFYVHFANIRQNGFSLPASLPRSMRVRRKLHGFVPLYSMSILPILVTLVFAHTVLCRDQWGFDVSSIGSSLCYDTLTMLSLRSTML